MDKLISFLFLSVSAVWIYHRTGAALIIPSGVFLPAYFAALWAAAWTVWKVPAALRIAGRGLRAVFVTLPLQLAGLPVRATKGLARFGAGIALRVGLVKKAMFHLLRENSDLRRRLKDMQSEQDRLEGELKFVVGQWLTAPVPAKAAPIAAKKASLPARLTVSFAETETLGFIEDTSTQAQMIEHQQKPEGEENAQESQGKDGSHGSSPKETLN